MILAPNTVDPFLIVFLSCRGIVQSVILFFLKIAYNHTLNVAIPAASGERRLHDVMTVLVPSTEALPLTHAVLTYLPAPGSSQSFVILLVPKVLEFPG